MSRLLPNIVITHKKIHFRICLERRNILHNDRWKVAEDTVTEVPVGSNITVSAVSGGDLLIHLLLHPKMASLERTHLWQRHFSSYRLKHKRGVEDNY